MAEEQQTPTLFAHHIMGELCNSLGVTHDVFDDVAEPFRLLIDSLNADGRLHDAGRLRVTHRLEANLRLRLQIRDARARHPNSFKRRITKPLLLIGLPRTGATFLHHLLNQDEENRTPRLWELSYPLPPPDTQTYLGNPRIALAEHDMKRLFSSQPELAQVHYMAAQEPDDCDFIFGRTLLNPHFMMQYHVPAYAEWFWRQPLDELYRWHRDELLLLQTNVLGNWVLRSAFHQWGIEAVRRTYPDAVLVRTHRAPLEVLLSTARYIELLRQGYSDRVDPLACGRTALDIVGHYLERFESWWQRATPAEQATVVDMPYQRVVREPLKVLNELYRACDRKLGLEARMRMQAWLKSRQQPASLAVVADAARYGLQEAAADPRIAAYAERCKPLF